MKKTLVLAVSAAVFALVVLPLQTYLGNAGDYDFSVWRLTAEQALAAALLVPVLAAVFAADAKWLGGFLSSLAAGLLACAYLETGPLSFGLPEINGEYPALLDAPGRRLWDAAVWAAVLVPSAVFFRRTGRAAWLVALSVCALGAASLFDVRASAPETPPPRPQAFALNSDVLDAVRYSPARNVLFLVCDSVPADLAADILDRDPSLAARFPGFVAYRNNICPMESTKRGVPLLLTGRVYEPGENLSRYMASVLEPESALSAYLARDWSVYAMLDVFSYGCTNREVARRPPSREREGGGRRLRPLAARASESVPYASLASVVRFRLAPFAFKAKIMYNIIHSTRANGKKLFVHDHNLFPALAAKDVSSDPRPAFVKAHAHGAHMPLVFDLEGRPCDAWPRGYEALHQAASNSLVHLSRLMDAYRAKGVYTNAFIVVAADHGSIYNRSVEGGNPKASALLMIKPSKADGPYEASALATTSQGVAEILRRVAVREPSRGEWEALLFSERRLFRFLGIKGKRYVDYHYRTDGTVESVEER
jgi:hypothetical protein